MPGFNRRGPDNQGPMTGGGRGICTGAVNPAQRGGRGYPVYGRGWGRGWAQRGFGGRGFGPARPWQTAPDIGNDLQERAKWLEMELAAVKQQLNDLS
ncbi:MAG TPA: DUF5320 domain-containing protein [Desulfotignum sp.]|nr:DUF5320 domain-containing protein [Desulfotignum sp.]